MADFDICNVYKRRPIKRKGDKTTKKHKGPSFKSFLKTREKFGVDGTRSDSDDDDSDDYSPKRNKKKTKLLYSELNKRLESEEASDDKDHGSLEDATNDMSYSTEPSMEPEPLLLADDKLEEACIELSDDEGDISYPVPSRFNQELPRIQPPPPVVPSIEEMTDLDPDLMKIATAPAPQYDAGSAHTTDNANFGKVCIKVQYVNLKKATDPKMLQVIEHLEKPVKAVLMENDPFDKLLQWYCQKKVLRKDNILLVYDDTPVMPRATPASLHMISGKKAKNLIQAYLKEDYKRQQEEESEMIQRQLHESPFGDENLGEGLEDEVAPVDEEVMHIKLRGRNNDDFNIRVKKTTMLRSIVKRYVEVKELGRVTIDKIRLSFDGEDLSLDDMIADTELEDEDVVTVIVS